MVRISASVLILAFFAPGIAGAQIVVSEIMYDLAEGSDSGREWIEVYNEEDAAVNLTEWKLFESSTNHGIVAVGAETLPAGAYAVIADNPAKFKADWPSFSGLLFDSSFSLNNTGEALVLRCCGKELVDKDSISYSSSMGGAGDGASLSRSGSTFVPTDPTPGAPPSSARAVAEPKEDPLPPARKLPEPAPPPVEKTSQPEQQTPTSVAASPLSAAAPSIAIARAEPEKKSTGIPLPVATKKKSVAATQRADEQQEDVSVEESQESELLAQTAATASADTATPWLWWAGALGIALVGAGGAYAMGRRRSREWKIIEETGEDV